MKQETFVSSADTIRDEFEPSTEFNLAEIQKPLFDKGAEQDAEMVKILFYLKLVALLRYYFHIGTYFYVCKILCVSTVIFLNIGSGRRNRNPLAKRHGFRVQF